MTQFLGKYRGKVENNVDPKNMGRLQVSVPAVLGKGRLSWALPSVPYAAPQAGTVTLPPKFANVWVEFEGGDPNSAIWTGCFWDQGQAPPVAAAAPPLTPNTVLRTIGQSMILISDVPGGPGITLMSRTGATIVINDAGIVISNGKGATIVMAGPTVTINQGALVIK
jgi:uncharacterized protein involved in type VI secretion and phage assembly